jgi:hypothetical protein
MIQLPVYTSLPLLFMFAMKGALNTLCSAQNKYLINPSYNLILINPNVTLLI